ncbi:winged helix-turn-helix transcriptional regulator [Chitinophaga solisilvae]|uniref:winged helix-turn-helix transcriptional regulator n=1 Tax=Chitinophaga solisilvae TaxID=1233460 RepID=UPI0013701505|nr:helix-turn-helix domain-containing protein [Chitinophaga solisilvae]
MARRKDTSTNSFNREILNGSHLHYALDLISGRWKILILEKLRAGGLRYSILRKELPHISERMLALQLKELEKDGLITRSVYAGVPPCVGYTLTPISEKLIPIWEQLCCWGAAHRELQTTGN